MRKNESARAGQKLRTESGPDRSSYSVPNAVEGSAMKGGPTNLDHSLKGNKSNMDYQKK